MTALKILVTGGAGAIGYQLARALAERGDEVIIADNYIRSQRDQELVGLLSRPNVYELNIDLSNDGLYDQLPSDVDYIYHLCAFNGTQNFYEHSFAVLTHSTLPTIHLLRKYGKSQRLKRFIYAGSSEAYACSVSCFNWEIPTDETVPLGIEDPLNPRWSYGGSKMHGELAAVAANNELGTPFTILRYHNIYGPRMGDKHVIPDFIVRAKQGVYALYGYEDTRSFLYVSDAVNATIACAESQKTLGSIVHLGSDQEINILELGKLMMKIMGKNDEITLHPSPRGSVKRRAPNVGKLKSVIRFEPKISLEEGLKKTMEFYAPELLDQS